MRYMYDLHIGELPAHFCKTTSFLGDGSLRYLPVKATEQTGLGQLFSHGLNCPFLLILGISSHEVLGLHAGSLTLGH